MTDAVGMTIGKVCYPCRRRAVRALSLHLESLEAPQLKALNGVRARLSVRKGKVAELVFSLGVSDP